MNIFVLDEHYLTAAKMLCDSHVRKMCLETAQILSGVMLRQGMTLAEGMPKPQNINHPAIAAVQKPEQINWLIMYNTQLNIEYFYRFGDFHKYADLSDKYYSILKHNAAGVRCDGLAKCCGELDIADLDIVTAYKKYYTEVKKPALKAKGLWNFSGRVDWTISK